MYVHILYLHDAFYLLLSGTSWRPGLRQPPSSESEARRGLFRPREYFFFASRGGPRLHGSLRVSSCVCVAVSNKLPKVFPSTHIIRCAVAPIVIRVFVSYTAFLSKSLSYKYIHTPRAAASFAGTFPRFTESHSTRHLCAARPITFEDLCFVPPLGE